MHIQYKSFKIWDKNIWWKTPINWSWLLENNDHFDEIVAFWLLSLGEEDVEIGLVNSFPKKYSKFLLKIEGTLLLLKMQKGITYFIPGRFVTWRIDLKAGKNRFVEKPPTTWSWHSTTPPTALAKSFDVFLTSI